MIFDIVFIIIFDDETILSPNLLLTFHGFSDAKPLILVDFAGHIPTVTPVPRVPVADPSSMEDALLAAFSCLRTMAMTTSSSLKPGPR
jgi:hypothetical protein